MWPKGLKHSEESKGKIRLAHIAGKNPMWKGDDVGYNSLHRWVKKRIDKPRICQICNMKDHIDLANITGNYNRDISNWKWLCRSCHTRTDIENGVRVLNIKEGYQGFQKT